MTAPFEVTPEMQQIYRNGVIDGATRITRQIRNQLLIEVDEVMNHQSGFENVKAHCDGLIRGAKALEKALGELVIEMEGGKSSHARPVS